MEIKLSVRHIIPLNFLLIAILAYLAARTVNIVVSVVMAPPVVEHSSVNAPRVVVPIAHARAYYDQIVSRDIFNLKPAPQAKPPVVVEDLHLKLLGVSQITGSAPFIIVQDLNGQQALYKLGDMIPNVGKVVGVYSTEAIVEHDGRRVAIKLPTNSLAGSSDQPSYGWQSRRQEASNNDGNFKPRVRDLGGNRYEVPASTVQHSMNHLSQLFTQIRAIPNIQNGRTNGFALSEIVPGSIFDHIGLHDGDVLTSIDGHPVNNPARAIRLLNGLRGRRMIELQVLRNGQPVTLTYEIN